MNKIINGVASEYDIPMNKETQILTRWVDPTIEQLQQENKKLKKEKEDLQQRIDKAIEFVQKTQFDCGDFNCCGFGIWENGKNELLEILKGENK